MVVAVVRRCVCVCVEWVDVGNRGVLEVNCCSHFCARAPVEPRRRRGRSGWSCSDGGVDGDGDRDGTTRGGGSTNRPAHPRESSDRVRPGRVGGAEFGGR